MLPVVSCPHCGNTSRVPQHFLGKYVRCKNCHKKFLLQTSVQPIAVPTEDHSKKTPSADEPPPTLGTIPAKPVPAAPFGAPIGGPPRFDASGNETLMARPIPAGPGGPAAFGAPIGGLPRFDASGNETLMARPIPAGPGGPAAFGAPIGGPPRFDTPGNETVMARPISAGPAAFGAPIGGPPVADVPTDGTMLAAPMPPPANTPPSFDDSASFGFDTLRPAFPANVLQPLLRLCQRYPVLLAAAAGLVLLTSVLLTAFFLVRPSSGTTAGKYGRYVGIEISSTAVKTVTVDFPPKEDGRSYSVVRMEETPTDLVNSIAKNSTRIDEKDLQRAVDVVTAYYRDALKRGIPDERIYVACSSGLLTKIRDKVRDSNKGNAEEDERRAIDAAVDANEELLKEAVNKSTGKRVAFVDGKHEAKCALLACTNPGQRTQTLLLDVGGGNTKGGFLNSNMIFEGLIVDVGTKTYSARLQSEAQRAGKRRVSDLGGAERDRCRHEFVQKTLHDQIEENPEINRQPKVYLLGGIVWAMATYMHPDSLRKADNARQVKLTAKDIQGFHSRIAGMKSREELNKMAIRDAGADQKAAIEEELKKVAKVFKDQELFAGSELLLGISEELSLSGKEVIFITDAQNTFVLGHIMSEAGIE